MELPWHVVHVFANHEKRVARSFEGRSIPHYLPLYPERSKWSDRTVIIERPLFAGYVFVRDVVQLRLSILSIPGVIRIVGGGGVVDTVSAEEINWIRKGLEEGYVLRPHPLASVGARVRVCEGIFSGVEGEVAELRHQCKVVVTVSAVQHCYSLEIPLEQLELVRPTIRERHASAFATAV